MCEIVRRSDGLHLCAGALEVLIKCTQLIGAMG